MESKLHVVKDYEKLDKDIREQIKLVYPEGYSEHLITFSNAKGELINALRFETNDKVYLVRMTVEKALKLIEDDEDFDENGVLRDDIKEEYEDKHSDIDYLSENDNYEDD